MLSRYALTDSLRFQWRRGSSASYHATDNRAWAKPGMARLVLVSRVCSFFLLTHARVCSFAARFCSLCSLAFAQERLGEVVASGRRSLYGCFIDSPAALFAAMGGGSSAVGLAQFRRALRRLDVAASDEAVAATVEMLDPERCYFRAFDGRGFVRILTPFCVIRPPPEPPARLQQQPQQQNVHSDWRRDAHTAGMRDARRSPVQGPFNGAAGDRAAGGRNHQKQQQQQQQGKPVFTWFADGNEAMSSQFIDRNDVLHDPHARSGNGRSVRIFIAIPVPFFKRRTMMQRIDPFSLAFLSKTLENSQKTLSKTQGNRDQMTGGAEDSRVRRDGGGPDEHAGRGRAVAV